MVANITIRKLIIYLKQITTKLLRKIEYLYKMRGYLHSLLFTCIQRVKTCSSNRFTCTLSLSFINKKMILLKNKNTSIISTPAGRWSKKARNRLSSTSSDFVSDKQLCRSKMLAYRGGMVTCRKLSISLRFHSSSNVIKALEKPVAKINGNCPIINTNQLIR